MKFTKLSAILALALGALSLSLPAISATQNGGSAFPLTLISTAPWNLTDAYNQLLQTINQQAAVAPGIPGAIVNFSTVPASNPLVEGTAVNIVAASINTSPASASGAGMILSGVAGRTIYPTGAFTIMASGGAVTGATSVKLLCYPSGNLIETPVAANLASGIPFGAIYASTGTPVGAALSNGCASGDGVFLSAVGGGVATATSLFVNFPYIVQ